MIAKIAYQAIKSYQRFKNEALNAYTEKLIRLMMIKDWKLFIELHHIFMVEVLGKYAKQSY